LLRLDFCRDIPTCRGLLATRRSAPVGFIAPALPVPTATPPEGEGWIHEIKHDGYRTIVAIDRGNVRAFSRRGHDWSEQYRRIVEAARQLKVKAAILDGEVVVQDERGISDFQALRSAIAREPHRLIFFAFDLLHLDGEDLRGKPLIERRERLRSILARNTSTASPIQFSDHVEGSGAEFYSAAERMGLEGIVSKKANSRYRSGTCKTWLKTKFLTESELVLVGSHLDRRGIPTLLLAREVNGQLEYAGGAMLHMPEPMREVLRKRAEALEVSRPVIRELKGRGDAWWFKPELRVRVRHLRGEPTLRHAIATALVR
jgi:bifunctional non-homologous end joining protein LigD